MTKKEKLDWVKMTFDDFCFDEYDKKCCCATIVDFLDKILDEPKTCHMKKSYQGQDIKDITIECSECGGHLGSTANNVKHFAKFCKNCGAQIDFSKGVEL